ncbi:MAG TPA: SDR family oxidoreductase [Bacteroidales bacterium]|nr:SDR family oxidoreductase [Bacteroidales bacterium]HRT48582.1 SDR family oxidoreductase [Bacteroidales bacterium]HRU57670.1 SDR family oxidoreductase [Bacteroidales bacterium]
MYKKLRGKRVLVTGGAGFIGSNLIDSLLAEGNYVVCLDNFSTGNRKNIKEFLNNKNFRLIEGDIRDLSVCREAVHGIDIVFHQAALGSVPRSIADPVSATDVNVGGFVKILHASVEAGVKRFIYAASSSTYGDNPDLPKVEERIGNPLSPYAVTKCADELFAKVFSSVYGIDVVGLRYFNVFGPKQDPEGAYAAVIPKFILQLMRHEQPVINGDGTISRDFTYVENVVQANHLAAVVEDREALNQVYNVACGESTTINRLYDIIREELGRHDKEVLKIGPVHGPERKGDIRHSLASIEKASKLLGYNPTHYIKEGMNKTVNWFIKNS